ncbi:MAG: tRNA pseudouridine(38-40) synthase TruA [Synergistaceae bacterium]|nr:tRNA pseudouridine(38-40) synthase TruA [Synergistaceae bacterium]
MTRYAAELSYNGALYFGWQVQPDRLSVQEAVEKVLTMLNKHPVAVTGAGRTDSGVHARGQVCSFDMLEEWDEFRLLMALNSNLPEGISAIRLTKVRPDFHARYDAQKREYIYFLWTGKTIYPHIVPFTHWIKGERYDWGIASEACRFLEGEHNFSNFCRASNIPEDPVRRMYRVKLHRRGALIWLRILGSGFLTNMVRIIMGNLELIAKGEREPEWINSLFEAGYDKSFSGRTFPPDGLFLWRIDYGETLWNSHNRTL